MNKQEPFNWDFALGLSAVFFGIVYGYIAYNTPKASFGNPMDPLYFPLGIATVAIILGIILLVRSKPSYTINAFKNFLNEDRVQKNDRKKVFATCVMCVVYALLFEPLGYVISTFVFMFGVLGITNGLKAWKLNLTIALIFAVLVYFIFSTLLGISLPPLPFELGE